MGLGAEHVIGGGGLVREALVKDNFVGVGGVSGCVEASSEERVGQRNPVLFGGVKGVSKSVEGRRKSRVMGIEFAFHEPLFFVSRIVKKSLPKK